MTIEFPESRVTPGFIPRERAAQAAFFQRSCPDAAIMDGAPYRLRAGHDRLNLALPIREPAADYFERYAITWHRHANHGLSSQVCCLNFLMPLATRRNLLSRLVGAALNIDPPDMLPVEPGPDGADWYVGFEWIGKIDYLNEAGRTGARTRGANVTSADAVVRFRHEGRIEALLIEWKYTERYGPPIPPAGNPTRVSRYRDIAFAPDGPIRSKLAPDLGVEAFFWEPLYQMLRQQMMAHRMKLAGEGGAKTVRVLHISPAANRALHEVTAPKLAAFGDEVFDAFRAVLVRPEDFLNRTIEQVFGPLLTEMAGDPWADYLTDRYTFLRPGGAELNLHPSASSAEKNI